MVIVLGLMSCLMLNMWIVLELVLMYVMIVLFVLRLMLIV